MQSVHTKEGIRENPLGTHFYSSIHSRITYRRRGSAVSLPSFPGKAAIICKPVITPLPHSSTPTPATTPCTHSRAGNTLQQVPAAKLLLWLDRGKVCEDGLSGGLGVTWGDMSSLLSLSLGSQLLQTQRVWEGVQRGETMLDPSSSEEEKGEMFWWLIQVVVVDDLRRGLRGTPEIPVPDLIPSVSSEGREERNRLQLYVYIMRCIAYPFNAKQPTDMTRRQQKVTVTLW
ncbi:Hypothetical predicted protein [Pelobates cultripes]|uniref:Uncharacterized protein n=1 Tax=Pelobates cultripes TaxID=61616 RepID=A0AAD1RTS2_PELCU|nr:Hypothetical predicted protein [Pelobates cultripes]